MTQGRDPDEAVRETLARIGMVLEDSSAVALIASGTNGNVAGAVRVLEDALTEATAMLMAITALRGE